MAEIHMEKQNFSKEQNQLMKEVAEQLNTIIQSQPGLENHVISLRISEEGYPAFTVKTTDGSKVSEQFGDILKQQIGNLLDSDISKEKKVIMGAVFQSDNLTKDQLDEYLKESDKFITFFQDKLNKSNITIGDAQAVEGTGTGAAEKEHKLGLFTHEDWLSHKRQEELTSPINEGIEDKETKTTVDEKQKSTVEHITDNEETQKELEKSKTPGMIAKTTEEQITIQLKTELKGGYLEIILKNQDDIMRFGEMHEAIKGGYADYYKAIAAGRIEYDGSRAQIETQDDGKITITYSNINTKNKPKTVTLVNSDGTLNEEGHADFCHIFKNTTTAGGNQQDIELRNKALEYVKKSIEEAGLTDFYNNLQEQIKKAYPNAAMTGITAGMCRAKEEIFSKETLNTIKNEENIISGDKKVLTDIQQNMEITITDKSTLDFIENNETNVERIVEAYNSRNELVKKYEIKDSNDQRWKDVFYSLRLDGYTPAEAAIAIYGIRNEKNEFILDIYYQKYISKVLNES